MAPGQSKLLRPALYLAVNALSPLFLSISLSLVFSTSSPPSTLSPFRKRVNRMRRRRSSTRKRQKGKNNTETDAVCGDGQKRRKDVSREMGEKRAMEH